MAMCPKLLIEEANKVLATATTVTMEYPYQATIEIGVPAPLLWVPMDLFERMRTAISHLSASLPESERDAIRAKTIEECAVVAASFDGVRGVVSAIRALTRNQDAALGRPLPESERDAIRAKTIEECLAVIPGGTHCDPQEIADAIRALSCEVECARVEKAEVDRESAIRAKTIEECAQIACEGQRWDDIAVAIRALIQSPPRKSVWDDPRVQE